MKLSDKAYDTIKWIGLLTVPTITFLTAIVNILGLPHGDMIVAILAATDVFIGAIVAIAKNQYDREHKGIEDKTLY